MLVFGSTFRVRSGSLNHPLQIAVEGSQFQDLVVADMGRFGQDEVIHRTCQVHGLRTKANL
jgi:hypothetical protein